MNGLNSAAGSRGAVGNPSLQSSRGQGPSLGSLSGLGPNLQRQAPQGIPGLSNLGQRGMPGLGLSGSSGQPLSGLLSTNARLRMTQLTQILPL